MSLSTRIAEWVGGLAYDDIPFEAAKLHLLDTLIGASAGASAAAAALAERQTDLAGCFAPLRLPLPAMQRT